MNQLQQLYKENEALNLHAENYVLLAVLYGEEEEQHLAEWNQRTRDRLGHSDIALSKETHDKINPYYHRLFPINANA